MDCSKAGKSLDIRGSKRKGCPPVFAQAVDFFVQIPQRLQNRLKSHFKEAVQNVGIRGPNINLLPKEEATNTALDVNLERQLQIWKDNPYWVDQPPEIKVSVPKGSLCNLHVKFKVGLPPDAIYNIVTDPDNRKVFKNIKEIISRRVLVDEGLRQIVEVEQAAIWRFLWFSGTISVHAIVDQNRADHSVKFKQGKTGFMKRFEGCWRVQPLLVDEELCFPYKPKTLADYDLCTKGKGRVGSMVSLEQLVEPALLPPPPISWYLRGITSRTIEMLITDLLGEATKIREAIDGTNFCREGEGDIDGYPTHSTEDIKERWRQRKQSKRPYKRRTRSQ